MEALCALGKIGRTVLQTFMFLGEEILFSRIRATVVNKIFYFSYKKLTSFYPGIQGLWCASLNLRQYYYLHSSTPNRLC